ncbi:hypothetical protein FMUND_10687 [Fusarium mundagurra]|uniref:LysM domain-containing protein n=1 Tax=Fusarium mundagurra TaxID=1567541 RepID=A0A8H5YBE6_9HYPO|nr:hypothetical protein FMUND_10687 [Fusarium mundagurra]
MKSIIVLSLVALAHARCDYPSGIGLWHPKTGQNLGVAMWDLGITEAEFKALNPTTNINLLYPPMGYNVTIGPSRSGKWTDGCPPSLRIEDTSDTSIVDPSYETQETPESTSDADADADGYRDQSTRSMYETVEASTRSSTVFADSSRPSSPSVAAETQSADTLDQPFTEGQGTASRPETHMPTESIREVPGSAVSRTRATTSEDGENNLINPSKTRHSDVSATSVADKSEDVHEASSMISDDAQQETAPSYATTDGKETRTPAQSDASSTSAGAESTMVNEKGQKPESVTEASSVPSSISGATKSETAPSPELSTTTTTMLTQTDGSHLIKTESPSDTSFKEECTESSKDLSAQESSGGAHTSLASTSTTDTATSSTTQPKEPTGSTTSSGGTTIAENTSTQTTKSADPDTASDQTTSSFDTALGKTTTEVVASSDTGSADQTGGQTTTLSTETKTTLTTSASKKTSGPATTTNSYDGKETRLAMCFYDSDLPSIGQRDAEMVYPKVTIEINEEVEGGGIRHAWNTL